MAAVEALPPPPSAKPAAQLIDREKVSEPWTRHGYAVSALSANFMEVLR